MNIAPEGFEPSYVMMKTLCLNHLTIGPKNFITLNKSPVQVSHLLQLVTKQLHYFYANQTWLKECRYFKHTILLKLYQLNSVIYKISTLYLKTFKFFQLKPIQIVINRSMINILSVNKHYIN